MKYAVFKLVLKGPFAEYAVPLMHVQPNGVNLVTGSHGFAQMSCIKLCKSTKSIPIRMSMVGQEQVLFRINPFDHLIHSLLFTAF